MWIHLVQHCETCDGWCRLHWLGVQSGAQQSPPAAPRLPGRALRAAGSWRLWVARARACCPAARPCQAFWTRRDPLNWMPSCMPSSWLNSSSSSSSTNSTAGPQAMKEGQAQPGWSSRRALSGQLPATQSAAQFGINTAQVMTSLFENYSSYHAISSSQPSFPVMLLMPIAVPLEGPLVDARPSAHRAQ